MQICKLWKSVKCSFTIPVPCLWSLFTPSSCSFSRDKPRRDKYLEGICFTNKKDNVNIIRWWNRLTVMAGTTLLSKLLGEEEGSRVGIAICREREREAAMWEMHAKTQDLQWSSLCKPQWQGSDREPGNMVTECPMRLKTGWEHPLELKEGSRFLQFIASHCLYSLFIILLFVPGGFYHRVIAIVCCVYFKHMYHNVFSPIFFPISLAHWPLTLPHQKPPYNLENTPLGSYAVSKVQYNMI